MHRRFALYSEIKSPMQYYSGTSGLLLPVPNKSFYPPAYKDKSRLSYYSTLFNSIEVNSSFYKVPLAATIKKWASEIETEDFKFTFKLSREITHQRNLLFSEDAVFDFISRIDQVGDKKGSLLVQFPGSIKISQIRRVDYLLSIIKAADPTTSWDVAVEFRDQSWYIDDVEEMIHSYQMGLVVHDMLPIATSFRDTGTDFVYLRYHGPDGDYKGSYEHAELSEYAAYISEWLQEGKKVYTYFNNTIGDAISNLSALRQIVSDLSGN
ncbi:DUF72 domain-containing protein [Pedobacter sp. MC2016-24]|nr:DUF72 domain-containing protein [Pedobacter sp. MC2016-24]